MAAGFLIRTNKGNFSRWTDLLYFMKEENLQVISCQIEYWGSKLFSEQLYTQHAVEIMSTVEHNPDKAELTKEEISEVLREESKAYEDIERAAINILLEVEKNKSRKEKAAEERENETISK